MSHRTWFWVIVVTIPIIAVVIAFLGWYRYGSLIVLPQPPTAQVFVNGQPAGFSSRLKPGSYEVVVSTQGYRPHRETITVRALQIKRLRPILAPLAAAKLVVSDEVDFLTANPAAGQFFFFNRPSRSLYRLRVVRGPDQKIGLENIPITPSVLGDLAEVAFAPDYSVAVIRDKNDDSGLYNFARYDLLHQELKPYDRDSFGFLFDPAGEFIYQLYRPGSERSLVRSDRARQRLERVVNLKELGLTDPKLGISENGEALLLSNGKEVYLMVVTTKQLTKLESGGSAARFLDNRSLLVSHQGQLEIVPFEIIGVGQNKGQEGKVRFGQATKLGVGAELADLALLPDRLIGVFEPASTGASARQRQFGSFELKTGRFLPLKLAEELPAGAKSFAADIGGNVLFIAQDKLWWLEL